MDIYHRTQHRPDKRHIHHGADLWSEKVMTAKEYLSQITEQLNSDTEVLVLS